MYCRERVHDAPCSAVNERGVEVLTRGFCRAGDQEKNNLEHHERKQRPGGYALVISGSSIGYPTTTATNAFPKRRAATARGLGAYRYFEDTLPPLEPSPLRVPARLSLSGHGVVSAAAVM